MASRRDIDDLQNRVYAAMRTLQELKATPQPISGDGWVFYRHDARPSWDLEILDIADISYSKVFKMTYVVDDPSRGFMNMFYDTQYQYDYQGLFADIDPVADDPYSYWVKVKHATHHNLPAGIRMRFYIFAPQKGELVFVEQ